MQFGKFCSLALLAFSTVAFSQEFRGTLSGLITDPASALVAGATVTVTEIHTGTKSQTVSDSSGKYTVPFLLPGDYDISVKAQGFKEFVRKSVHAGAGDHIAIDLPLEVGSMTQLVEVTASTPLLNS